MSYTGKFLLRNWLLLSGSTVQADQPHVGDKVVTNLKNPDPDLTFETEATTVEISGYFPRSFPVGAWALHLSELPVDADVTFSLQLDGVEVFTETVPGQQAIYSPFELPPYQHGSLGYPVGDEADPFQPSLINFLDAEVEAEYWSVSIVSSAAPMISHILIGPAFVPALNFQFGSGIDLIANPNLFQAPSGNTFVEYDPPKKGGTLQWGHLGDSESVSFDRAVEYAFLKKAPIVASLYQGKGDSRERHTRLIAYIADYGAGKATNNDRFSGSMQLVEVAG